MCARVRVCLREEERGRKSRERENAKERKKKSPRKNSSLQSLFLISVIPLLGDNCDRTPSAIGCNMEAGRMCPRRSSKRCVRARPSFILLERRWQHLTITGWEENNSASRISQTQKWSLCQRAKACKYLLCWKGKRRKKVKHSSASLTFAVAGGRANSYRCAKWDRQVQIPTATVRSFSKVIHTSFLAPSQLWVK